MYYYLGKCKRRTNKMNIKTIVILLPCWLILLCLSGCGHKPYARQYKIALVHSYEEGYPDAERTRRLLCEALAKRGLSCDFREYFLNCDGLLSDKEEEFCSLMILPAGAPILWQCWMIRPLTRSWPAAILCCTTCLWCSAA